MHTLKIHDNSISLNLAHASLNASDTPYNADPSNTPPLRPRMLRRSSSVGSTLKPLLISGSRRFSGGRINSCFSASKESLESMASYKRSSLESRTASFKGISTANFKRTSLESRTASFKGTVSSSTTSPKQKRRQRIMNTM